MRGASASLTIVIPPAKKQNSSCVTGKTLKDQAGERTRGRRTRGRGRTTGGCCTQKAGVTDTIGALHREGKAMLHPVPRALPPRSAASGCTQNGTAAGVASVMRA